MDEIKISVIISTYNKPKFLSNTINSLKNQNFSDYEIIVVDNACSKSTRSIIENVVNGIDNQKSSIKYIQEPHIGLHNARHRGAKEAIGNILLFTDDDIIADKNLLQEIIKPFSNSEVGCVGGKILPKWEIEPPEWINIFPEWYLSILDEEQGPKEVQWIYGCNFSIRKDLLFEVGGFNPDAFAQKKMWCYRGDGEMGLLRKVHNVGKKVIYNPRAIIWHFIPKTRLTVKYFEERAFKSGIEASYTNFRYNAKTSNIILLSRSIAFGGLFLLNVLKTFMLKDLKANIDSTYFKSRFFYETKLFTDNKLRDYAKKLSYLDEE